MAAKKNNAKTLAGGILLFIGSLIYLYVVFGWYSSGAAAGPWLAAAQFFAPFVAAVSVIGSISLFFLSLGVATGKAGSDDKLSKVLWKCVTCVSAAVVILSAGGPMFYLSVLGFIVAYIGAVVASM